MGGSGGSTSARVEIGGRTRKVCPGARCEADGVLLGAWPVRRVEGASSTLTTMISSATKMAPTATPRKMNPVRGWTKGAARPADTRKLFPQYWQVTDGTAPGGVSGAPQWGQSSFRISMGEWYRKSRGSPRVTTERFVVRPGRPPSGRCGFRAVWSVP